MIAKFFILLIRIYQKTFGPMVGNSCRFYPTCSNYSLKAFEKYGFFKGFYLTIKRIFKCHPWHPGGHDPVP